jgi:hypothetical protein
MTNTDSGHSAVETPRAGIPLVQMQKALAAGEATPLSRTVTDIVRFQSSWWLFDRDGWVPVDSQQLSERLDAAAREMAIADHHAAINLQP